MYRLLHTKKHWIPYPRYIFRKILALELIKKYIHGESCFLEVGGGAGDFSIALIDAGYKGKVIDFSEYSYEIIKDAVTEKQVQNLQVEKKGLNQLDVDEKYDFIVFFEVLEHIKNDDQAIKQISNFLKNDGYLVLSVPAKKNLWDNWDILAGHVKRYEKHELMNLLRDNGFEITQFYSYGFPFLNILKIARKFLIRKSPSKSMVDNTKKSGINIVSIPLIGIIFNQVTLLPFIKFSKLFNKLDLAEGYLCLAKKIQIKK